MTVIVKSDGFWQRATLIVPGDDGERVEVNFRCRFRRLKTSEARALGKAITERKLTDAEVLDKVLVDWDLKDVSGNPVPIGQRSEAVEETAGLEGACVEAYFEAYRKGAEEKN